MTLIRPGMVLAPSGDCKKLKGPHRVLKTFSDIDQAILIPIPSGPRKKEGRKKASYYAKGFIVVRCRDLEIWLDTREVVETTITLPACWYLSDDEIRAAYPPRGKAKESSMILRRDYKLRLIEPLLDVAEGADFNTFLGLEQAAALLAKERGASKIQILDALHRYFAFGSVINGLLPNYSRSGAPGVDRIAKDKKAGRKNAAARTGNDALAGKILTDEDRRNLADGWAMFVRPGSSVPDAFLAVSSTFYSKGQVLKHGVWSSELLEAHLRPTIWEFKYHGPKSDDKLSAARRLMGEGTWARDYQPLCGSSRDGIVAIGQVGSIDASPIDVNLNAIFSRLCPIGVGRGMFIRDGWLGLYHGLHVAIGGVGTADANLTILSAATDKTQLLRRYGLEDLDPEGIPPIFFSKYLSDNGELRSLEGINATVKELGSRIEFVERFRADRNSVAESGHHSRHRGFDHHLEGTTKGRQAKRGEPLAITRALLTRHEYMRLLLLWIYWANTQQQVPHLRTAEMRRQDVAPTRIAIYQWAKQKGYIAGKIVDSTFLESKLLPTFTASVQRNGIVLHRPNTGNAVELLPHARFYDDYLATSGIIRSAMNGGQKYLSVRAHPEDLSKVLFMDQHGIHVLRNTSDDAILLFEGSIPDLCAMKDADRREKVEGLTKHDQDLLDQKSFQEDVQESARANKLQEIEKNKERKAPQTKRANVRANQAAERQHNLDAEAKRASPPQPATRPVSDTVPNSEPSNNQGTPLSKEPCKVVPISMADHYRKRLRKFHNERDQK